MSAGEASWQEGEAVHDDEASERRERGEWRREVREELGFKRELAVNFARKR